MTKKKKYGVLGMMDWIASIPCGKATIKVPFGGGSLNGYGTVPASYCTKDVVIQHAIENSDYFKKGKIKLLKEYEIVCDTAPRSLVDDVTKKDSVVKTAKFEDELDVSNNVQPKEDSSKHVEVTDIDEARDYLVEKCGVQRSTIRSAINVFRTADELGIVFDGIQYH